MTAPDSSSDFTNAQAREQPFGPPLIGALLRMPWEAVQRRMLARLHERACDALGAPPLASRLGELERLGSLERRPDPDDLRSKRVALTRRGESAIRVIREAVGEVETTWAQQLGSKRLAEARGLLGDLNGPG